MDVELHVRASGALGVEYVLRRTPARTSSSSASWSLAGLAAAAFTTLGLALALAIAAVSFVLGWRELSVIASAFAFIVAIATAVAGRAVVEEALLVVPALGVQLRKTRRDGSSSTKFVDARSICAVVIHEAITFADVPYLLAFMVDGQEDSMLLAFEAFRPRIGVLKEIYRGTKRILFSPVRDGENREEGEAGAPARAMRLPKRLQASLDAR